MVGDVRFHSGFVASIGKAMIEEKKPGENRGYADDTMVNLIAWYTLHRFNSIHPIH